MNIKNLPMKFSLLALVVLLCLWALNVLPIPVLKGSGPGLREGLDLAGGDSVIFRLRTSEVDVEQLRKQVEKLTADYEAATSEEQKRELRERIDELNEEIDRAQGKGRDEGYLLADAIANLKRRLDPNGLLSLEITPLRNNSIQIRMPAAKEGTRRAEREFREAISALGDNNISRLQIRSLLAIEDPQQQADQIELLSAGSDERAKALEVLIRAYRVEREARAAYNRASGPEARQQAEIVMRDTAYEYDKRLQEVLATNLNIENLRSVLQRNYVTRREERSLRGQSDGPAKVQARRAALSQYLDELYEKFPDRKEDIKRAVDLYSEWDEQRVTLGDMSDLKRLVQKAGVLEFRIAPFSPFAGVGGEDVLSQADLARLEDILQTEGPEGMEREAEDYRWLPVQEGATFPGMVVKSYAGQKYLLVYNRADKVMLADPTAGGWRLTRARPDRDENGQPVVSFAVDPVGASLMATLTGANVNRHMAIILDGIAYSAPSIRTQISDRGMITGVEPEEVSELVRTLRAGWLTLDPVPVSESSFGPGIGQDNKERGFRAAIWSLIAVACFMMFYYLLAGAVADVALLVNVILILGFMSIFRVVLTLPGIAGLVLTIGIAVDANVLIFERLREEQRKGQSPTMTIKNAYQRAFSAIFDANLTTLITCVILGWISTAEIRGFAITLGLGVAFSMFTALVVTRWVFQALLNWRVVSGHVSMLQIIGAPNVNWIGKRYIFWGLSGLMIVLGIYSLVWQGDRLLGIQFTSGTQLTIRFKADAMIDKDGVPTLPSDGLVRAEIAREAGKLPNGDRLRATALVEQRLVPKSDAVREFLERYDALETGRIPRDKWRGNAQFFEAMDADADGAMTRQELLDRLPPSTYQLTTTETNVKLVTDVVRDAFGAELQLRPACRFDLAAGEMAPRLGLTLAEDGLTRVVPTEASDFRDLLSEFEDGVVLKITNVSPNLAPAELKQRISEMRYQPDFADKPLSEKTEIVGLTETEEGLFSSFLVFSRPPEAGTAPWRDFAASEELLLESALQREDSMEVLNFDAQIASQAQGLALMAIILSCVAIVLYLWLRFGSIQWGLAAVVCLAHDVIIVVGLVAASGWLQATFFGKALGIQSFKVDLFMVAAFLTVIGYSVNDTIVVFDRIRENRGKLPALTPQIINRSINQTLSRTLLTSSTTLIVLVIMYIWGGPGIIHAFSYALLAGVLFGTYSSVAIASPLLLGFKKVFVTQTASTEPPESVK